MALKINTDALTWFLSDCLLGVMFEPSGAQTGNLLVNSPDFFRLILTAVHLITGVLTVRHLITATRVSDAGTVFALELCSAAQSH